MPTVRLQAGELSARIKYDAGKVSEAVKRGIVSAANRAKRKLAAITPVDQGVMKAAWEVLSSSKLTTVTNSAPHAGIIELGARPHGVSLEGRQALFDWIMRVVRPADESEAWGVVEGICKKLMAKGQKGHFLIRDNLELFGKWLEEEVSAEVAREMSRG